MLCLCLHSQLVSLSDYIYILLFNNAVYLISIYMYSVNSISSLAQVLIERAFSQENEIHPSEQLFLTRRCILGANLPR